VGAVVEYFARLRGLNGHAARVRTACWLERLGVDGYRAQRIEALSKGNQQRVQLAAALVADPEVAFLDEPFTGLDPVGAALVADTLCALAAGGSTIVVSTHQMRHAETLCHRVAMLVGGCLVRYGTPAGLMDGAADPTLESVFIAAVTGESAP
jgi:ABC-2 type transport system ATP-binding protein